MKPPTTASFFIRPVRFKHIIAILMYVESIIKPAACQKLIHEHENNWSIQFKHHLPTNAHISVMCFIMDFTIDNSRRLPKKYT